MSDEDIPYQNLRASMIAIGEQVGSMQSIINSHTYPAAQQMAKQLSEAIQPLIDFSQSYTFKVTLPSSLVMVQEIQKSYIAMMSGFISQYQGLIDSFPNQSTLIEDAVASIETIAKSPELQDALMINTEKFAANCEESLQSIDDTLGVKFIDEPRSSDSESTQNIDGHHEDSIDNSDKVAKMTNEFVHNVVSSLKNPELYYDKVAEKLIDVLFTFISGVVSLAATGSMDMLLVALLINSAIKLFISVTNKDRY